MTQEPPVTAAEWQAVAGNETSLLGSSITRTSFLAPCPGSAARAHRVIHHLPEARTNQTPKAPCLLTRSETPFQCCPKRGFNCRVIRHLRSPPELNNHSAFLPVAPLRPRPPSQPLATLYLFILEKGKRQRQSFVLTGPRSQPSFWIWGGRPAPGGVRLM